VVDLSLRAAKTSSALLFLRSRADGGDDTAASEVLSGSGASAPRVSMVSPKKANAGHMSVAAALSLFLLLAGVVGYRLLERWPLVDCVYAAVGVITTIGIVVTPRSTASAAFTAALNVLSLGVTAVWLSEIADARRRWWARQPLLRGREGAAFAAAAAAPLAAAAAALAAAEGWPLPTAGFVALCCATGLGLADAAPQTAAGKLIIAGYVLINMGTTLSVCASVGSALHDAVAPDLQGAQLRSVTRRREDARAAAAKDAKPADAREAENDE
jgi:hypothetical protein